MIHVTVPDFLGKGGFILCTKGYADITTPDCTHRLKEGMLFVTTPLVSVIFVSTGKDFEYLMFLDDIKVFYPIFMTISGTGMPMAVREQPCWKIDQGLYGFIVRQAARIAENMNDEGIAETESGIRAAHCDIIRRDTMMEVLKHRFKGVSLTGNEPERSNRTAYQFILSLHRHYRDQRSVEWYAREAGLSPGYFAEIIRKASGISPSRWISSITISYAKLLLEKTDKSIKEIASELNFPEQFTFRKYFKQHAGISPKEYRKRMVSFPEPQDAEVAFGTDAERRAP